MTCKRIFDAALRLLDEAVTGAGEDETLVRDETAELAERAPYILAAAVGEMREVDVAYRAANGLHDGIYADEVFLPLEERFPLSARFAHAAAFYLAAMLTADENPELSDTFFDRFCDAMATIRTSIPAVKSKIRDVYA